MKKILLILCWFPFSILIAQQSSNSSKGMDEVSLHKLKTDIDRSLKKMNTNYENVSVDDLIYSSDIKKQELGWKILDYKAFSNPALKNNWADRTYEYTPEMEKYKKEGYDINKTVEGNEQRYNAMGYNISKEYRDADILVIGLLVILTLVLIILYLKKHKSFETIK